MRITKLICENKECNYFQLHKVQRVIFLRVPLETTCRDTKCDFCKVEMRKERKKR